MTWQDLSEGQRPARCADRERGGEKGSARQKSETCGTEPGAFEEQCEEHAWQERMGGWV